MKAKRLLIVSDFHCGHEVGLTPPKWNPGFAGDHMAAYRAEMWGRFVGAVRELGTIDVLVANGDLVDGRSEKTGGLEIIVLDRELQAHMACDVISAIGAKKLYMTRGTDYHVGPHESWENLVAERLGAEHIGDVINLDVNGLMFNFRHHIGGSQTPIGRTTPLAREAAWNVLWHVRHDFPMADVIVRSHVHYHAFTGGPGWLAMTTPALQGYGTRYGERRLSGLIDWGFVVFDIRDREDFEWSAVTFPFPHPQPSVA